MTNVVVPLESIRAISERFANTAYGFFLGKQAETHPLPIHLTPILTFFKNFGHCLDKSLLNAAVLLHAISELMLLSCVSTAQELQRKMLRVYYS
ncbi:hypothetical protein Tco_0277475 [Tanacetum coccineum]